MKNFRFLMWITFLFSGIVHMTAQSYPLKGVVEDTAGEPLTGASVVVEGKKGVGTATDIDGRFQLNVQKGESITISYVGFQSQTIAITGQNDIRITLQENSEVLDDVVVVGFATQKKVNLTGAVGLATAKDLESRPVTTVSDALQGVVPGLQLTHNAGDVDTKMNINIRGTGTIGEGSIGSPLILIDGMEGDINTVNPNDVESISVLKDAAASSIYGSRAAFGVVLITTKKGSTGKTNVTYSNSFRFASPIGLPKMMDSYTFANYWNEAYKNSGWGSTFSEDVMRKMLEVQAGTSEHMSGHESINGIYWGKDDQWDNDPFKRAFANTDWYKELYKDNNFSQEHNASISGGNDKVSYYASIGYLDYNGMLRHGSDGLKRYNATGKFNAQLASWARFNYASRYIRQDIHRPTDFSSVYEKIGRQTWPNLPVYDDNGYYFNSNADTPAMKLALGGESTTQNDQVYQQAALILEPVKNWVTNIEFNYNTTSDEGREVRLPYYNHDVAGNEVNTHGTSSVKMSQLKESYLNWNIYTSYSFNINKSHEFKVMAGFQSEEQRQKYFSTKAYGLQDFSKPEIDLTTGLNGAGDPQANENEGYRNQWSNVGFFGRINYDYMSRYLLEANLRYDGSSRFREGKRWTWSPSVSIGWNIAQENFWEDFVPYCNTLKLRGSYGTLANQNTNSWYPTYRTMKINQNSGKWLQNGLQPNTSWVEGLVSSNLTWEKVRTWNIGLDWGLFNNRLTGNFDVFTRYTDDMVGPANELPAVLGADAPYANNCDLKTRGWELRISWQDRTAFGLIYGATFNISDARTYIRSYPGNSTHSLWGYNAGREIGEIWGYETIGIAKTKEEMDAHLATLPNGGQDALGWSYDAGDIMYRDLNGDGKINSGAETLEDHGDLKKIGNTTPRYMFGLNLNAAYKGFDVSVFFQGVAKRDYWSKSPIFWGAVNDEWWSTGLAHNADYFRAEEIGIEGHKIPANLDSYYPRPVFGWNEKNRQTQTRYLQDASYIRLKNLQVGYTLPQNLTQRIAIQKLRFYVSVDNLWTSTKLSKAFDPETIDGGYKRDNDDSKMFGNSYPLARTWSFGLTVNL